MKHVATLSAALALALAGCGGGDDADGGTADGANVGDAGSGWCATALAIEEELDELEEDIDNDDFYDQVADAYRRIAEGAPDELDDDIDRVISGFALVNDWLQDPTSDYPLSDAEDAELTASIDRINVALEQQCGIDIDDSDDFDDSGDASIDDGIAIDGADDELSMEIETEDGSGDVSLGGELPDEFPLPTPSSYRVGSTMVFDEADSVMYTAVLHIPFEDFDPAADLYETFLGDEGFEVSRTDMSSSDVDRFVLISGTRDGATVDIVMSITEIGNDDDGNLTYESTITLSWDEDT